MHVNCGKHSGEEFSSKRVAKASLFEKPAQESGLSTKMALDRTLYYTRL